MKKYKLQLLRLAKETPESRKQRVSAGYKFRAVVFENKKKAAQDKYVCDEEII